MGKLKAKVLLEVICKLRDIKKAKTKTETKTKALFLRCSNKAISKLISHSFKRAWLWV